MDFGTIIPQFGSALWTAVFFIIALSVIVTIHELGHYLVGRWCGIGAEVFSVGFGPVLWSRRDRRGTRWQIAALPLGGYVKFLGDADAASRPDLAAVAALPAEARRRTMTGAPLWARAATVAAGPFANFLLAAVVFAAVFAAQGVATYPLTVAEVKPMPPIAGAVTLQPGDVILAIDGQDVATPEAAAQVFADLPDTATLTYTIKRAGQQQEIVAPNFFPPLIGAVMPRSAAEDVGLRPGDVVLSADGTPLANFADLARITAASQGRPLLLEVWRDGTTASFTLVPRETDLPSAGGGFEKRYLIGLTADPLVSSATGFPGVWSVVSDGIARTWEVIVTTILGIGYMITGAISTCNIQGPLAIAEASGSMAAAGSASFIVFIGFLSAAIGLMNLLPVPVLDGGHLALQLWEALTGRMPSEGALRAMMAVGLVLVVGLMVFGLGNDLYC